MLLNYTAFVATFFAITSLAYSSAVRNESSCTAANTLIRKEWGTLSRTDRKSYTDAVLCLQNKPSLLDPVEVPGAKNHFDDFIAVHINQTIYIHLSGYFLPWHRVFVRLYEKALNDCGYSGTQPYWDWPLYASNLTSSPIFDGSPYSLSGDGAFIANNSNITLGPGIILPHGNGGGCVTAGPFVNMTVPFRAFEFSEALAGVQPNDRFNYTPRCLSRDLNSYIAETYTNQSVVDSLLYNSSTITEFQTSMNGVPGTSHMGVHGGGHFSIGSVGSDFFNSPGDPAFYLHHSQIDRIWTIWQSLDPVNRQNALSGTKTLLDNPPSANVTLEDTMNWGVLGPEMTVAEAMSTTSGPFCYEYA